MTAEPKDPGRFYQEFVKGIWKENPIFVQVLGMCPTLAVTNTAINALAMGIATTFVLIGSSFLVSLLRRFIPSEVRISTYIVIIATFVTAADFALQATVPNVHRELGAFIALIVVNCIILGRQEAFAARNPVGAAVADAIGMGLGFTLALFLMGAFREVLGFGSFFGVPVLGPKFEPWIVMILPPGGFLMLGMILLVSAAISERRARARVARNA